jgi:peptidoglycan/xylan/chitin deacetylase (PgdA/CDA1 family)
LLRVLTYRQAEALRTLLCACLYYTGLAWLMTRGRERGAAILIFHSVSHEGAFWDSRISPARFERVLRFLVARRRVVPVSDIVQRLQSGETIPDDWIALTFDDGYADNAETALPILQRLQLPAAFFIPTAVVADDQRAPHYFFFDAVEDLVRRAPVSAEPKLSALANAPLSLRSSARRSDAILRLVLALRSQTANGQRAAVEDVAHACGLAPRAPPHLYCSAEALRHMQRLGMEIGSHSVTHADLGRSSRDDVHCEIRASKDTLEAILSGPVTGFAYPFGKKRNIGIARTEVEQAGYRYALTTESGFARKGADRFLLPRIAVRDAALVRLKVNLLGLTL